MTPEETFAWFVARIDDAVFAEVPDNEGLRPETEEALAEVQAKLLEVLGLPADHTL